MKTVWGIFLLFMACGVAVAVGNGVGLKPGRYDVTTTMSLSGKSMSPNTKSRCIAASDLQDPERIFNERFLDGFKPESKCSEHNVKINGSKVSYDEDCPNRSVHVDATVSETGYSAVRSVTPKSPRALPFTYKISAKRTGDCTH